MGFKESNSKGMPELRLEESTAFWCQAQCRELRMRHSERQCCPSPRAEHCALWKAAASTRQEITDVMRDILGAVGAH